MDYLQTKPWLKDYKTKQEIRIKSNFRPSMVDIIFFLKRSFPLVYRFDVPVLIHYRSLRDRHDLKAGLDIASKILQKCSYGLYKISFSIRNTQREICIFLYS